MNVALVIEVVVVSTKSSADSISNGPVSGRVAVAIFPSGLPVLKKKGVSAAAEILGNKPSSASKIANRA